MNWTTKALSHFGRLGLCNEFTQDVIDKRNFMSKFNRALSNDYEQVWKDQLQRHDGNGLCTCRQFKKEPNTAKCIVHIT